MVEFKFQWQKFKMESSEKDFIEKYISRIKKYAETHNISEDLLDDINQSILDKLFEIKWDITQKKLVSIVNSIWEPEDIFEWVDSFESEPETKSNQEKKSDLKPYEKWQKTNWTRPRDKSILLWVCAMFWQATWINRWVRRILAILWSRFFLAADMEECFFFWRWVYIILALIFPIKDKDYKHCSMLYYRWTQVRDLRLCIPNFFKRFWNFCKWIVKTAIPSTIKFLSNIFWPLWKIVKWLFLICWSLFLIWVIVWLWVVLYCLIWWLFWWNWFVLWNIDYLTLAPTITKWWVLLWIISAFLLLLASLWSLFKRKLSNNISLIVAIWCGLLAITIAVISLWEVREIWNISWTNWQKITKEIKVDIPDRENELNILIEPTEYFVLKNAIVNEPRLVNMLPSDDGKLKVVYTFTFKNLNEEYTSQAVENLSDVDYEWVWDDFLAVRLKDLNIFSKKTPAVPMYISIDLYVPKDLKFKLHWVWYMIELDSFNWEHTYRDCNTIKYDEDREEFYCNFRMTQQDKYNHIEWNLKWMADGIVPLKWTNSAWSEVREWKKSRVYDPYRRFDSMIIYNDNSEDSRLLAKYSDKFFNFFVEVEYKLDEETHEFFLIQSHVKEVEQKWLMDSERMKQYIWRENLSDFDIQMKEDEEEKFKKEQEIQELQDRIKVLEQRLDVLTLDSPEN